MSMPYHDMYWIQTNHGTESKPTALQCKHSPAPFRTSAPSCSRAPAPFPTFRFRGRTLHDCCSRFLFAAARHTHSSSRCVFASRWVRTSLRVFISLTMSSSKKRKEDGGTSDQGRQRTDIHGSGNRHGVDGDNIKIKTRMNIDIVAKWIGQHSSTRKDFF